MTAVLRIDINPKLFLRDPDETELGRALVAKSVLLIESLGFERFTFKKLASAIQSTEASMYRYFQSKHQLLSYLLSWYWSRLDSLIDYRTANIDNAETRLNIALEVLTRPSVDHDIEGADGVPISHINERALHHIVTIESTKMYIPKELKKAERDALMQDYERLCERLAEIIKGVNPHYRFPRALVTAVIHTIQRTSLYSEVFPALTEIRRTEKRDDLLRFIEQMCRATLANR